MLRRPASSASIRSPTPQFKTRPGTPSGQNSVYNYTPPLGSTSSTYSGNIKVSIRAKPSAESDSLWEVSPARNCVSNKDVGEFAFDNVYDGTASNEQVYDRSVRELVSNVMSGFHGTVFAYGMTGSGKTYSMQGSSDNPGIIPLSVQSIFQHIWQDISRSYSVKVAYLEIYNEHLNDLLNPGSNGDDIRLRDDSVKGVRALGLREVEVSSPNELLETIAKGDSVRKTDATEFNARSSRSHAVVQISIDSVPKLETPSSTKQVSTLYLCDLAGSERAVSQAERRKEGAYINKSLLTLGTVIARLSSPSGSNVHVPYRDSKLTRLLQPALSGKSLVSVLCTIQTGSSSSYTETVSTLRFAARAKNVVVNVKRNEEPSLADAKTIERLMQQIEAQKLEIEQLRLGGFSSASSASSYSPSSASSATFSTVTPATSTSGTPPPPLPQATLTSFATQIAQLEAENKILNERVEHLTRLCDDSRLDEVLGLSTGDSDSDTGDRKQSQQIEEYKSYISHLEKQLYQQELSHRTVGGTLSNRSSMSTEQAQSELIQDLQEEIDELRESNQDKDRIIAALRSLNKRKENLASYSASTLPPNGYSSQYSRYYFSSRTAPDSLSSSHSDTNEDNTLTDILSPVKSYV
ncbi:kinesin-like protein Kip2p [Trichomonascus vanleenenianus]|uniref:kinesin-like protein Kip2p n=1 Tax=Trichomonascus vanleenenianus TaxID=2268995 RepID=UPI003ECAD509